MTKCQVKSKGYLLFFVLLCIFEMFLSKQDVFTYINTIKIAPKVIELQREVNKSTITEEGCGFQLLMGQLD